MICSSRFTEKEVNVHGGIIHFTVMDHDLMWSNDFEGEAFLEIAKLPGIPHESAHDNRPFDELKQIELALTHPKGSLQERFREKKIPLVVFLAIPSRIIEILEQRATDKTAAEFVRQRRETESQ